VSSEFTEVASAFFSGAVQANIVASTIIDKNNFFILILV
jgi:hypothetical protein